MDTTADIHKSDKGLLKLDNDRRACNFRGFYNGTFFADYQMIGLFSTDPDLTNTFINVPFAKRADLHNKHHPVFWFWHENDQVKSDHPHPDSAPSAKTGTDNNKKTEQTVASN